MSLPTTQSTWLQVAQGEPVDVLKFSTNAPVPKAGKREVLVKVSFAGLNPGYQTMMRFLPPFTRKLPAITESDLSGTVVDAGDSTRFKNGDLVFGIIPISEGVLKLGRGAICQYAVVADKDLCLKPSTLSLKQAAGLSLAGSAAHHCLTTVGGLKAGDRLFINGGGTAVGRLAIQVAKVLGAHVVVSCSSSSRDAYLALGANETLDYTTSPIEQQLASSYSLSSSLGFNLILDTMKSLPLCSHSAEYLLSGCEIINIGGESPKEFFSLENARVLLSLAINDFRPTWLGGPPKKWSYVIFEAKTQYLEDLARWAEEGKLTVPVDSIHDWNQESLMAAYALVGSGKAKGKVIVRIGA